MEIKTLQIPLAKLQLNTGQVAGLPKNPRFIRNDKFERLVKSLQDDPEMTILRELVAIEHNGTYVVIMGNMRLRALREIGSKQECSTKWIFMLARYFPEPTG